jgi:hypothetical protein
MVGMNDLACISDAGFRPMDPAAGAAFCQYFAVLRFCGFTALRLYVFTV